MLASIRERRIGGTRTGGWRWLLVIATIPAALIGFAGEDLISEVLHADTTASGSRSPGFLVIGAILLGWPIGSGAGAARSSPRRPGRAGDRLRQALALLPGISRSGATISAGLALGLTRESAARFSFLLATPITLGAGLYGSRHLLDARTPAPSGWRSARVRRGRISGLLAIGFLLAWLRRRSFMIFSVYRVGLAALVVALVMAGHDEGHHQGRQAHAVDAEDQERAAGSHASRKPIATSPAIAAAANPAPRAPHSVAVCDSSRKCRDPIEAGARGDGRGQQEAEADGRLRGLSPRQASPDSGARAADLATAWLKPMASDVPGPTCSISRRLAPGRRPPPG